MLENVTKYNAWEIFEVEEAQDCESIAKLLEDVKNANKYLFNGDGPEQLKAITQLLMERKRKLGCS